MRLLSLPPSIRTAMRREKRRRRIRGVWFAIDGLASPLIAFGGEMEARMEEIAGEAEGRGMGRRFYGACSFGKPGRAIGLCLRSF
jgi:hypothetical protein